MADLIDGDLPALMPSTITSPQELRARLAEVRRRGFATAYEELEEGLSAVAAPVRHHRGSVTASVSVSGPASRLTHERVAQLAPLVVETADQIGREIGYREDRS